MDTSPSHILSRPPVAEDVDNSCSGIEKLKVLTLSSLYPNHVTPSHGVFVENRIRRIVETGAVDATVLAPVPWFPFAARCFGHYADYAKVRPAEERFGIDVLHPSYPVIPKFGMNLAPALMYVFLRPVIARILRSGFDFDLIDAHYFYPDGVAAAMLASALGKPLVITARGSDINLIPQYRWPRRLICWAARNATAVVAVSQALKDEMRGLGIAPKKIHVLRNGVDLNVFRPMEREESRTRLGVQPPTLLMVGNLVSLKGHEIAIRALACLPKTTLLIVGQGPREPALRALVSSLGLDERVRFLGTVEHSQLCEVYNAADVLLLPSSREGMPNVLLEAMACGVPVVASNVGGSGEVVSPGSSGMLLPERTSQAIVEAVRALLDGPPDRSMVRAHAEQFGWESTTEGQLRLFDQAAAQDRQGR